MPDRSVPARISRSVTSAAAGVTREVFRLAPPLVLWWGWLAFAVANAVGLAFQGASARFATVLAVALVAVTGLAYALTWRPKVIADPSGLTVVNPFRDHHLPWTAIKAVDTAEWVQVHYGEPGSATSATARKVHCWALYITSRSRRRGNLSPARPRLAGLMRRAGIPEEHADGVYATTVRLPEEARYLASLPPAMAIAARLDTRARTERTQSGAKPPSQYRSTWRWHSVAAAVLPALALLIIVVV